MIHKNCNLCNSHYTTVPFKSGYIGYICENCLMYITKKI